MTLQPWRKRSPCPAGFDIPDFLQPDTAATTIQCLRDETPWGFVFNRGPHPINVSREDWKAPSDEQRQEMTSYIYSNANGRFHISATATAFKKRPTAARSGRATTAIPFSNFLNGPAFLEFARSVTGFKSIRFVDAKATLYRPHIS